MIVKIGLTKETMVEIYKKPLLKPVRILRSKNFSKKESQQNDRTIILQDEIKKDFSITYDNLKDFQSSQWLDYLDTQLDYYIQVSAEDGRVLYEGLYFIHTDYEDILNFDYRRKIEVNFIQL